MDKKKIIVNGYLYPFISRETLDDSLPFLTFISTFSYGLDQDANLIPLDDQKVIQEAQNQGVGSLMVLTSYSDERGFDNTHAIQLFNNETLQDRYFDEVLENLRSKNMRGVDFDFEYIGAQNRDAYTNFVARARERLNAENYLVTVALAPKISTDQAGELYEGHDYQKMGLAADFLLLMTYEWGYAYGPPMAIAPINQVRAVLDYAVTQIEPQKILMGIPNYGYDWTLPFKEGARAKKVSNVEAIALAAKTGSQIQFCESSMSPYFRYTDEAGHQHEVWFEDKRSYLAKLNLIYEYDLAGVGIWNVMDYDPNLESALFDLFHIYKDPLM